MKKAIAPRSFIVDKRRMGRAKQLLLDDSFKVSVVHGGQYSVGKRKTARPISTRKPMHLTLRSSYAVGSYSFRTKENYAFIDKLIKTVSKKWGIRIYKNSINGNHLHFDLLATTRRGFQNFLRVLSCQIAAFVTKAVKGKPFGKRFFDLPAFTRIAEWGKAYKTLKAYVVQNVLEASGVIPYQTRKPMRLAMLSRHRKRE